MAVLVLVLAMVMVLRRKNDEV
jgi:hypothetical protein